jgi:hypothetical protein
MSKSMQEQYSQDELRQIIEYRAARALLQRIVR